MLNPSTANATVDDPTIGRCISFAKAWGYGSLTVGNLFAYRTPSPEVLKTVADPVGPDNDRWLDQLSRDADLTVAAWGNHGTFRNRGFEVATRLRNPHCLRVTARGQPSHPLYVRGDCPLTPWALAPARQ